MHACDEESAALSLNDCVLDILETKEEKCGNFVGGTF